jgi:hypothetical protein
MEHSPAFTVFLVIYVPLVIGFVLAVVVNALDSLMKGK